MDSKGCDASKLFSEIHFAKSVQYHQPIMDEVLQLLEKTNASLDVAHSSALQISDSAKSFKVYVCNSDVEDDVHQCLHEKFKLRLMQFETSFSKFKSATMVEEKLVIGEEISHPNDQVVHEMLKII
ncbi:evolutionarily conserved C-terminal region 1, partial [Striga asiatica]